MWTNIFIIVCWLLACLWAVLRASPKELLKSSPIHANLSLNCSKWWRYVYLKSKSYPSNVKWSQDGQHLILLDLQRIENEIIPSFFRHRNMLSFVRQVFQIIFSWTCITFLKLSATMTRIMKLWSLNTPFSSREMKATST